MTRSVPTPGPVLARLRRPAAPTPTRLAVIADPHLSPTGSGTWKVYHRSEQRLREAVGVANACAVDAALLVGDLTRDGRPGEYEAADAVLSELDAPLLGVPGNHDVPKRWDDYEAPSPSAYADRYARGKLPFRVGVGGVDVVGIDTASGGGRLHDSHEGLVTESTLEWLDDVLPAARSPVVLAHHPLTHPREHTGEFPESDFYTVRNAAAVRPVLSAHDVPLVLSGHLHWPATAAVDGLREVVAPSTTSFPPAMLVVDVDRRGTTVRFVPLAGPRGMAEAYTAARKGNAHAQGIVGHADRGVLSSLPLADEWEGSTATRVTGGVPPTGDDTGGGRAEPGGTTTDTEESGTLSGVKPGGAATGTREGDASKATTADGSVGEVVEHQDHESGVPDDIRWR